MNPVRNIVLLAGAAIAALAFGASTASAQETPIEAINESTGEHCTPATCNIHIVGTSSITVHLGGVEVPILVCTDEFEAQLEEDGTGHIGFYNGTGADCLIEQCNGIGEAATEAEWPITETGETGPNEWHLTLRLCFDQVSNPNGVGSHCTMELHVVEDAEEPHHYMFSANDVFCPEGGAEINGQWGTEVDPLDHDEIEILHL